MRLFHRHVWKTLYAQHGQFQLLKGDATVLFQKCYNCPKLRVDCINGHWPLDMFIEAEKSGLEALKPGEPGRPAKAPSPWAAD